MSRTKPNRPCQPIKLGHYRVFSMSLINDVLRSRRDAKRVLHVTNYITVPGNTSRATADQIGAVIGAETARAMRRNT